MINTSIFSNDEKNANVGIYVPFAGNPFHLAVANLIQQARVVRCIYSLYVILYLPIGKIFRFE